MRVTVTGGAGFIGSHLVDRLVVQGYEVQLVDNLVTGLRSQVPAQAHFVEGCITDPSIAECVTQFAPECLVHLAAQVDVRVSLESPVHDAQVNVTGTVAMLEAARRGGSLRSAVLASSAAVYGVQKSPLADETHPLEPINAYGAAKLSAEIYWSQMGRLHGVHTTALRFANVYGPRQSPKGEAGVVAIFCRRHQAKQVLTVFGDGQATRDYLYVGDVVEAICCLLKSPQADQVYNLGTGVETSVLDLIREIKPYLKKIPLIGNGDLDSAEAVVDAFEKYDVDGVMIARASLGKPWLFAQCAAALRGEPVPAEPTLQEQRDIMLHHYKLVVGRFGEERGTVLMRKYACCYAQGKFGARFFRRHVAKVESAKEFYQVVEEHFPLDKPVSDAAQED